LKNWTAGEPDEVGNTGNMENEVGRGRKCGNKTCGKNQRIMNVDNFSRCCGVFLFGAGIKGEE